MLNSTTIKVITEGQKLEYATPQSSGMDLRANNDETIILKVGERKLIPTGIKVQLAEGTEMQIRSRSGLALKKGIIVWNAPGTIDADYRGEVGVILYNGGDEDFEINKGDRIAQAVVVPYLKAFVNYVDKLDDTQRGEGGFGHTGV